MKKNSYKEYLKKLSKKEFIKDEDGLSLIEVNIKDKELILSSFSANSPIISEELATYFDHKLTLRQIQCGIHINITCEDNISENDKLLYKNAIKNYYEEKLYSNVIDGKKKTFLSIILLLTGLLVLSLIILCELLNVNYITLYVFDIVAWVLIWEATDIFLLQRPIVNYEKLKCYAMINSVITYNNK